MKRLAYLLLTLSALCAVAPAQAQPPPPTVAGYQFYAFLDVTSAHEEPLPNLIRRELPDIPSAWFEIEKYISAYYPNALTSPRSRTLKAGSTIRLPIYTRPSELVVRAAPPPPKPTPALPARQDEPIIGALIEADAPISVEGSLGQRRRLNAVDNVRRGDTITTDDKTTASVRLLDGTLILLRTESSVLLKEFRFAKSDVNNGVLSIQLLTGAMRTISGLIPKDPKSKYSMSTPGGSVAVRGTDYAVRWCAADGVCMLDGEPVGSGLYAGVLEGGIDIPNANGSSPADAGEIVRVANPELAATPAPEMAPLVFTPEELKNFHPKIVCALPPNHAPTLLNGCGPRSRF